MSADGQYFADRPTTASSPIDVDVVLPDAAFRLRTDRGVFSHGKLDQGTSLLLRSPAELPEHGDLLDLGCGSGAIALTMAQRAPASTVWAVDVNERARELCAFNAQRAGLDNVRVTGPDDVPGSVEFAALWSNPPIRIGKARLHELLTRWLGRLRPGAEARLVVQKHLGADSLQRWLVEQGHTVERAASKSGYRLLVVTPPRPHGDPG